MSYEPLSDKALQELEEHGVRGMKNVGEAAAEIRALRAERDKLKSSVEHFEWSQRCDMDMRDLERRAIRDAINLVLGKGSKEDAEAIDRVYHELRTLRYGRGR